MATLKLTLEVEEDGRVVETIVRRVECDEIQRFTVEKPVAGFTALPTGELAEIAALVLRTDQPVTVRLDGQSDAGIVLNAGGLIALIDVDIDVGAATNVLVSNTGTETALLRGVAGGT